MGLSGWHIEGRREEAGAFLLEALALAREHGQKFLEARSAFELCHFNADINREDADLYRKAAMACIQNVWESFSFREKSVLSRYLVRILLLFGLTHRRAQRSRQQLKSRK